MRKPVILAAVLLIAWNVQAQDQTAVFNSINKEVQQRSEAYQNLKKSTATIGHRLTGSTNGKKSEEDAFRLLKTYGLTTTFQPFKAESWSRESIHLHIIGPDGRQEEVKAVALGHSPEKVDITHEMVDMGNGLEADYLSAPEKAKGKIVFAALGLLPGTATGTKNLHRSEKTALAIRYGAAGVILFNGVEGGILLTGTASVTGKVNPIPAVNITYEDGMRLKRQLASGALRASVSMRNFSGTIEARNVIASIPGKKYPNEKIVVAAHLDSWDLATGATDNGLGAYEIIDIARTFKALNLSFNRTIEFVLFMGEEQGLLGSKFYVEDAKKSNTLGNIKYVFNFDMSGSTIGFNIGGRKEALSFFKVVGEQIRKTDTVFQNRIGEGAGLHSDHQPFMLEGIPTASSVNNMPSSIYRCYHASCDDISLIKPEWMKDQVRFSAMMIWAMANTTEIPATKLDDAAIKTFLEQAGLKEPLKIAGDWRWKE